MTGSGHPCLGILATHAVQYYVPWYRELSRLVELEVFFAHRQTPEGQGDAGFAVSFDWDVPLEEGYRHTYLRNVARAPTVGTFFGCDTPEIARLVAERRFDAFIVQGWATRSYWQAIRACWLTGTPILVRGDSQLPMRGTGFWRVVKYPLYRNFIPRFDGYLIVGERARDYLYHYGADESRMFFTPHAVDNGFFERRAVDLRPARDELRRRWGLDPDATVFLFAGKFIAKKRPQDFVRAIALASVRCGRIWGLMVGDGPLRASLEAQVVRERSPIRFTGFLNQTEMPQAYAASDVLVLPSDGRETWGLVVNEAMASRVPAVVSEAVGCAPDLVVPGETGQLFPPGDVAALASLLAELDRDRSRLRAMGDNARLRVDRYSIQAAAAGTVQAVKRLGRSGPRPARSQMGSVGMDAVPGGPAATGMR